MGADRWVLLLDVGLGAQRLQIKLECRSTRTKVLTLLKKMLTKESQQNHLKQKHLSLSSAQRDFCEKETWENVSIIWFF